MLPFKWTSYIEKSLSNGERLIKKFELHEILYTYPILWIFFITYIYTLLKNTGMEYYGNILLITGLILVIIIYLSFRSIEYSLTDKRVVRKKGIISIKSDEILLNAIETIELNQSILGRILNYGTVIITGRGQSTIVFPYVKNPIHMKQDIEDIIIKNRKGK